MNLLSCLKIGANALKAAVSPHYKNFRIACGDIKSAVLKASQPFHGARFATLRPAHVQYIGMPRKSIDVSDIFHCIIVGGGPAGLLAGVYLSPRRRTILVKSGESRARWIPKTRNVPGFADGISGCDLLERLQCNCPAMKSQSRTIRSLPSNRTASASPCLRRGDLGVVARSSSATGVEDLVPEDLGELWNLVPTGRIRLCPICDAYELTGKRIGLIANRQRALGETEFLRAYSAQLTLLTHGNRLEDEVRARLMNARIAIHEAPVKRCIDGRQLAVTLDDGVTVSLDALYIGVGVHVRSELAVALGARVNADDYLYVDQRQQTSVNGLYAAGDVVQSLSQISVAFGQAAIASSAINYALNDMEIRVSPPKRSRGAAAG